MKYRYGLVFFFIFIFKAFKIFSQENVVFQISDDQKIYDLYPQTLKEFPQIPSPFTSDDGVETVVVFLKNKEYAIIPVTVENDSSDIPYGSIKIGKGNQLLIDSKDFPTLEKTGLHSDEELELTRTITGIPLHKITEIGRPEQYSEIGFMAEDEDILSVLKGDNHLVRQLELTHPQMARPLFHIWNIILTGYASGSVTRIWDNIDYILYRGRKVRFGEVFPTRGFQESIFNDEIRGTFQINFYRDLDENENNFLKEKYTHLNEEQMNAFVEKLSHILTGEMEPYYVMRYGFYEGHTSYRVDPIAIAFIFGLKSIEEIEDAFPGRLFDLLFQHFTEDTLK
ncbi:hypothetical protein JW824_03140 [bacterium]|nr:hypothetical protein [bacterium]RQV98042.1 MAG: hypothetical protein EH221_02785 [bacterium]